jgi:phosphoribosylamine--glycine ligase
MASAGYPGSYESGKEIRGVNDAENTGATVFQAGTRILHGRLETSGGRVLGVTASGADLRAAIDAAYVAAGRIEFDGMHYRRDIGHKGLARYNGSTVGT